MKKLLPVLCAAVAASLLGAGRAAATPVWAGRCGIASQQTVWGEYGWPALLPIFGRPGELLAVTSGTAYRDNAKAAGAALYYFDLHLKKRVGLPTKPADPDSIAATAQKEYAFAVTETDGCTTPVIVENELFGAGLATPWTDSNTQYRADVLSLLQHLSALGAHPILLVNSTPFTGGDALGWWLDAAKVADVVREVYVPATQLWPKGALLANRTLRTRFRRAIADFTSIGIPANRLGVMVSFATTRGAGGRNGLQPSSAWFQVAKWEALSAKEVAAETGLGSVWSWGWAKWSAAENDPDKAHAACAWLWARSPSLCDAPTMLGSAFDASLTEGQLDLPAGAVCTLGDTGAVTVGALRALQALTGDRDAALSALFERLVESAAAPVSSAEVAAAEQTVIDDSFAGSRTAYLAALRQAHATAALARGVIGDELRQARLQASLHAPAPRADEVLTFYSSYPHLLVRKVRAKPSPAWLGGRPQGYALSEVSPADLFTLPLGRSSVLSTLAGPVTVKALTETVQLGALPLSAARPAITAALRNFARGEAFEQWTIARQHAAENRATCFHDQLPKPAAIDLAEYLPFLRIG